MQSLVFAFCSVFLFLYYVFSLTWSWNWSLYFSWCLFCSIFGPNSDYLCIHFLEASPSLFWLTFAHLSSACLHSDPHCLSTPFGYHCLTQTKVRYRVGIFQKAGWPHGLPSRDVGQGRGEQRPQPFHIVQTPTSESPISPWSTTPLRLDPSAFFPSLGGKTACKPCLPCDDIHGCSEG